MSKILSCLKKRDLLHNPNISNDEFVQYGWEYLKQERPVDALDFFEKAQNLEGIQRIREWSLEQGDPFLLQQTSKMLKEQVSEAEESWRKVGEKAKAAGRHQQALMAFKAVADEEKIQEIQDLLKR
jgi:tetratricopeptide (TPR) repeat protein